MEDERRQEAEEDDLGIERDPAHVGKESGRRSRHDEEDRVGHARPAREGAAGDDDHRDGKAGTEVVARRRAEPGSDAGQHAHPPTGPGTAPAMPRPARERGRGRTRSPVYPLRSDLVSCTSSGAAAAPPPARVPSGV